MTNQLEWLDRERGDRSRRSIFLALDLDPSNMGKRTKDNDLTADQVIAIAYEMNTDPVSALYETGHLREVPAIEQMTREELAEEIYKLAAQLRKELEEETATIHQLHPHVQGVQQDWELVADSSPDEQEPEDDWTDPNNIP